MHEIERFVIGSLLNAPVKLQPLFFSLLGEENFFTEEGRKVFKKLKEAYENNETIHTAIESSLLESLSQDGIIVDEEGIEKLKRSLLKARLNHIYQERGGLLKSPKIPVETKREVIEELLREIEETERELNERREEELAEAVERFWEDYEILKERLKYGSEFETGFPSLDQNIVLRRGFLTIVASRPAGGKTTFAIQMSLVNAKQGKKVLFFSQEMNRNEILARMVAYETGVKLTDIIEARLTKEEEEKLKESFEELKSLPIKLVFEQVSVDEVIGKTRLEKPDMVVVDYLQLLKRRKGESEYEAISRQTTALRQLAKTENCLVVALAQINREAEKKSDKRPSLADLKGSGQIEQDADLVLILHNVEKIYKEKGKEVPEELRGRREVILAKNRHKPFVGKINLKIDEKTGAFTDPTIWQNDGEIDEELENEENFDLENFDLDF